MKEEWEWDFEWLKLRHGLKSRFSRNDLPSMESILYLVGIQEFGYIKKQFTKEEKQDLMHIAICRLFEEDGYFEWRGRDEDGWPHYEQKRSFKPLTLKDQETRLREKLIHYFSGFINEASDEME